jgi:hypothetical protein
MIMGFSILGSAVLSVFIIIKGQSGLIFGTAETPATKAETLSVPQPDAEKAEEVNETPAAPSVDEEK